MSTTALDQQAVNDFSGVVEKARKAFNTLRTKSIEFRKIQLQSLLRMYEENVDAIIDALHADLRKSKQESILLEFDFLTNDVRNMLYNLDDWVKPDMPSRSVANLLDAVYVLKEPYGVVLILGAWNYPFQLSLMPFAAALAAGNCIILKPSEIASASAKVMATLIPRYLDNECYHVVLGGASEASSLLKERFDYIFFTGSPHVGKLVHAAANRYLTPTILELGGKSPVYMDDTVDVEIAARRILWGKWTNAGQTCIAPDYLLCSRAVQEKFVAAAERILTEWYGSNIKESPDFSRIVNERHFQRLTSYLKDGKIAYGGNTDPTDKFLQVTVLTDVMANSPVMQEEIFGPILPIFNISNVQEAIAHINQGEKPLSLYIFSNNDKDIKLILTSTSSGGTCVNDTMMHFGVDTLPFGGVGNSGMGMYHGKYGFDALTHHRACLYKDLGALGEKLGSARYPPYSESKLNFVRLLMKKRKGTNIPFLSHSVVFGVGVASALLVKSLYYN